MTSDGTGVLPRLGSVPVRLRYDRASITPGIVHLGVGAFCRAHIAVYVDDLLTIDPSWGIIGASLRSPDTRNALAPQRFFYTLAVRSGSPTNTRVIGSLINVLDVATQRHALLIAMADPRTRIVSLTVTEKGYCRDPATGSLDPSHPDILHDLAVPEEPTSAPGLLVKALELRHARGTSPFTVLCCDNLPANGETVARVVCQFAALRNESLAEHIRRNVAFPSTMVDRIVPATTDDDRKIVHEQTGLWDAWPVVAEPFSQWVIEDRFPAGRPPFEAAGAQLVADVQPFERRKLRMLNGTHSSLAYLGYLAGYELVSETIADAVFHNFAFRLMTEEASATLDGREADLAVYRDALLERFRNPAIRHRTWQIAMDGSQKLPQRLLGTIRDRLVQSASITLSALGVAAWMRYVSGIDEQGHPIDVRDPLAARLRDIADTAGRAPTKLVDGLLSVTEVFGDDLWRSGDLRSVLVDHVGSLFELGARATAQRVAALSR